MLPWLAAAIVLTQTAAGQLIADVRCAADPRESYALYLPRAYTPDRAWPVIFLFDPGARGAAAVERYQAAAERFGVVLAGSNTSRNGSADVGRAVSAMTSDVGARVHVDARRIYTAGMSGGARVALGVALASPQIAGVIASSAGYPDSRARRTLGFPIYMTAGTEDFNHLEMRTVDQALTSPHRLTIFEGGHEWLSSDLAVAAVAWLELQAMKAGTKARDDAEIDAIFAARAAQVDLQARGADAYLAAQAMADDFDGLRDVSAFASRAAVLAKDKAVRDELRRARDDDARELRELSDVRRLEAALTSDSRADALADLRLRWKDLSARARAAADSADRRLARRLITNLAASLATDDPDYRRIVEEFRFRRPR